MTYPCDAKTIIDYATATSTKIILPATSGDRTILYVSMDSYDSLFNNNLSCGSVTLSNRISTAYNGINRPFDFLTLRCNKDINLKNDGSNNVWAKIVYVDRNIASTTEPTACFGAPTTYNGFTQGEIITTLFLFLSFLCFVFTIFIIKVTGVKIRK